jgi:hypothetical protein
MSVQAFWWDDVGGTAEVELPRVSLTVSEGDLEEFTFDLKEALAGNSSDPSRSDEGYFFVAGDESPTITVMQGLLSVKVEKSDVRALIPILEGLLAEESILVKK